MDVSLKLTQKTQKQYDANFVEKFIRKIIIVSIDKNNVVVKTYCKYVYLTHIGMILMFNYHFESSSKIKLPENPEISTFFSTLILKLRFSYMEEICGHNRKIFYASQTLSFQRILDFDFEIEISLYGRRVNVIFKNV